MDAATQALMKSIATKAAEEAVAKTLVSLGIDPQNPIEAQRNMQALEEIRKNMEDREYLADQVHLRNWRKTMNNIEGKGLLAVSGLLIFGAAALRLN